MEHVRCVHTNIEISKLGREGGEFAATAHADRDGKPKKQKKKGGGWKINEKKDGQQCQSNYGTFTFYVR